MMATQSWLPKKALVDGTLRRQLESLLLDWAGHWLNCPSLAVSDQIGAGEAGPIVRGELGSFQPNSVAVVSVACLMLGMDAAWVPIEGSEDWRFLEDVAAPAFQDLTERLSAWVPPADEMSLAAGGAEFCFTIELAGQQFGTLCLSQDQAVRLRRQATGLAPGSHSALHRADQLVDGQIIKVGAFIGAVELSYCDLRSLKPGQVIALPAPIAGKLLLTINERPILEPVCSYGIRDDGAVLTISSVKASTPQ
jgi:flagellar motor switch/type III secretory pathway protein FliN